MSPLKNLKYIKPLKLLVNRVRKTRKSLKVKAQFKSLLRNLNTALDVDIHYLLSYLKIAQRDPPSFWKYDSDFLRAAKEVSGLARQSMEGLFTLYASA